VTFVRLEAQDDVATVTLDHPHTRNALSGTMFTELGDALLGVTSDVSVRFIVLRGAGGLFSSGGDLRQFAAGLPDNYLSDYWQRMRQTILLLRNASQAVISVVDGVAVGAGAALALAADVVLASRSSRLRFSFVRLGLVPDAGTTFVLGRALGPTVASDLLMTGRWIEADEAHRRGLIARLYDDGNADAIITEVLADLRRSPAWSLALTKELLTQNASSNIHDAVRLEGVFQKAAEGSGNYRPYVDSVLSSLRTSKDHTR
jgi:2-(1,2-epoxy-1,2-dihydrophenyl)acetyl-CoA isomerase